ncbi:MULTISPECIES: Fic family protein [unclassified Adlercreutzia]|uniref:Fic family protein n=1 Tax=unclassified Adlercreutzia TaxID=2636013 RepID=UPI0013E9E544|nr:MULTISPECIES: Fic family protein [unclassified Adlercreutzia]
MTAEGLDSFAYEPARAHESEAARRHYWAVAIGLQRVDGLEVSPYVREAAAGYVSGERTLEETGRLVRAYHNDAARADTREADLVAQRIAELLAAAPFCLAPDMLAEVHRYLFQDLDPAVYHPGELKAERMVKQEEILNGDSVLYADPLAYDMALKSAFAAEQGRLYTTLEGDELAGFCHFLAFLWQVHPFYEGNTRTVAVFAELYLNHLGFDVSNEPFESNARYFRDALVRAMYRNAAAGIFPDESFLAAFFENALGRACHVLDREDLVCAALFDAPSLIRNVDPANALDKRNLP